MKKIRPYLTTRSLHPENQEAPIHFLHSDHIPGKLFYRRNHFAYPENVSPAGHLLISGLVRQPYLFRYQDFHSMHSKTITAVLECAGNKRANFKPAVFGEQWEDGAIGEGRWTGVPLHHLFSMTGLSSSAKEVVFEGWDKGERTDMDGTVPFARSLPVEKALHPDTILAYEYNGRPLSFKHGFPLRLIVPQWYAMSSVKWVKRITVIDHKFQGPFQSIDYNYYPHPDSDWDKFPVTTTHVNSIIQKPLDYEILNTGIHEIKGIAWSGEGEITAVDISLDGGQTWNQAGLSKPANEQYAWTKWSIDWEVREPGEYEIRARASDSAGRTQPAEAFWNRKGYGYNAIQAVHVKVE
ncbi:sulfite oxidase [Bacillus marinisedimentorum]|uniref:sulfite oxidase n=1 Tax=Bacillus marinisedimentorum TaxID=1821260 RepID=UPI0008729260|nr:sulfite oxidase [Bacillus marinisedimentorum]